MATSAFKISASHKKMTSHPASHVTFSHLPRELRDIVYDRLWSGTLVAFRYKELVVLARYDTAQYYAIFNGLPRWLITNRQFLEEGMQQFHYNAQFTVGEHNKLPLYEHRHPHKPFCIATRKTPRPGGVALKIKDSSCPLLDLTRARRLKVDYLCVAVEVAYDSRQKCVAVGQQCCNYEVSGCCIPHVVVAIIPKDRRAVATEPNNRPRQEAFENFEVLAALFRDDGSKVQDLDLIIRAGHPRLKDSAYRVAGALFRAVPKDVIPEIRCDWRFFDKIPRTLHRLRVGIIGDSFTTVGSISWYVAAMNELRKQFDAILPTLIQTGGKEQAVWMRSCSYVTPGQSIEIMSDDEAVIDYSLPLAYRPPRSTMSTLYAAGYKCSLWEVTSIPPLPQISSVSISTQVPQWTKVVRMGQCSQG
ncbi:hypothetical protein FB567DRAFT_509926 [Paraphoma chrysanthemicola]|uniref:Uncharacterized protein n=1 Tax=Paraphoma chrysanthemicola TaxID=798071 RepID=A0A8K0RJA4_9PLEO|nr:hypothetical protein FB567DRAFT_509926 [Paraphoma chrysanthemicola]